MPRPPQRDASARVGTNLSTRETGDPRSREPRAWSKDRRALLRSWKGRLEKVFGKADMRVAKQIVDTVRHEYHQANLALGTERSVLEPNRTRFRNQLDRKLAKALPRYREMKALLRERRRALVKLGPARPARAIRDTPVLTLGTRPPLDSATARTLLAPYPLFEQNVYSDLAEVRDDSYVLPEIGHLVQQYDYLHDDDGPYITQIFGISWPDRTRGHTGCGANFTTQAAGRLRIVAELQNYYSKFNYSVEDLFGFSETEFEIALCAYCYIGGRNRQYWTYEPLVTDGLTSFGSDLAYLMLPLDNSAPYTFDYTTEERYEAGALVEVVAGASLFINSDVNDMRSHANGIGWWRLNSLTVDSVP